MTLAASALSPVDRAAAQEPLRVLLVTGGGYHDYTAQKDILAQGIAARANVTFTVDHEAGESSSARLTRHATDAWADAFDVVVYNTCFADVTDAEYVERIVRAHVARQLPAVVLHCTMHSYNYRGDNPIWSMFLGVRTRRHQRQMPFTVEALAPEHPIMAGFPAPWRTPQGELYEILDVYPTATPLAHALGEDSGQHQVNVWVNRFAGVRVFGTTIGHHNETMSTDAYLDLVARGLLWAAGRLDETARPAPGYGPRQSPQGAARARAQPATGSDPRAQQRKVVFVAGRRSHGYGAHEHHAGSLLLARLLEQADSRIDAVVHRDGWPADPNAFDDAAAIVIYADGGRNHPAVGHLEQLDALMDRGVGLVLLHYAVEVEKETAGAQFLDWVGGYFETHWSVNPHWTMQSRPFPAHPVARGVASYEIDDEWYYHMRFRDGMAGITPILTALPPASSLEREDGPHENNPHVRAAVLERHELQHLAWAAERTGGGRGFGFTGGHWHWNWGHPMQRQLVLNAIVWAAGLDVPSAGIDPGTVTMEDLEANQDFEPRPGFDRARWSALVERWRREY